MNGRIGTIVAGISIAILVTAIVAVVYLLLLSDTVSTRLFYLQRADAHYQECLAYERWTAEQCLSYIHYDKIIGGVK